MKPYESILANSIYEQGKKVDFGEGRSLKPIISFEDVKSIEDEKLNLDYRAKTNASEEYGSVFEGLAFDKVIRSQSFAILEGEKPVAIMNIVIAPKFWIEQQRYLERVPDGVKIIDAKKAIGVLSTPDYFVIPAWANVVPSHRGKLTLPGFQTFKNILAKIEEQSPDNTYVEMIARGQLTFEEQKELNELINNRPLDSIIKTEEFPFDMDLIGKNSEGSKATIKAAKFFDYEQVNNIGSANSLGPVFYKRLK